jgi:hypothetical protein
MHGVNRLAQEAFWCPRCEEEHPIESVNRDWKCPTCGEFIHVQAISRDGTERIAIIRKRASELREGDLFLMPGQLDGDSYQVLGVNQLKNGLGIGLRGWGKYKIDSDEPVNCRIGTWS